MSNSAYLSDLSGRLFKYNVSTGTRDFVGDMDIFMTDLAVAPNGQLYGITFDDLYKIDTSTGNVKLIGRLGNIEANGLFIDPYGKAYVSSAITDRIYDLNLSTGDTDSIGSTRTGQVSAGDIAMHRGQLWWSNTGEELVRFNSANGNEQETVFHGIFDVFGLLSNGTQMFGFSRDSVYSIDLKDGSSDLIGRIPGIEGYIAGAADIGFGQTGLTFRGKSVADNASGTDRDDIMYGFGGDDVLKGAAGRDLLFGGAGDDTLSGGADADRFIFQSTAGQDTISSFSHAQGDRIDLRVLDADSDAGGNQAFDFIGRSGFSGAAGELRYSRSGGDTIVRGDTDGDGAADFAVRVTEAVTFRVADFLL